MLAAGPVSFAAAQADKGKDGTVRIVFWRRRHARRRAGPCTGARRGSVCRRRTAAQERGHCRVQPGVRGGPAWQHVLKPYTFKARPECIAVLQQHFGAVSVANNHSGDYGPDGLLEEFTLLEKASLPYFGGGRDRKKAHRPLILSATAGGSPCWATTSFRRVPSRPASIAPGPPGSLPPTRSRTSRPRGAIDHADLVIPMLHWGEELEPSPDDSQKVLARSLIDAGADAVIGAHPHVSQTVDIYKGRPIIYSLGNFVFDYDPGDPLVWTAGLCV